MSSDFSVPQPKLDWSAEPAIEADAARRRKTSIIFGSVFLLIGLGWLVTIIGLAYGSLQSPVYRTELKFLVDVENTRKPQLLDFSELESIRHDRALVEPANILNALTIHKQIAKLPSLRGLDSAEIAARLRHNLSVETDREDSLYAVSLLSEDKAGGSILHSLIDSHRNLINGEKKRIRDVRLDEIREQLAVLRKVLVQPPSEGSEKLRLVTKDRFDDLQVEYQTLEIEQDSRWFGSTRVDVVSLSEPVPDERHNFWVLFYGFLTPVLLLPVVLLLQSNRNRRSSEFDRSPAVDFANLAATPPKRNWKHLFSLATVSKAVLMLGIGIGLALIFEFRRAPEYVSTTRFRLLPKPSLGLGPQESVQFFKDKFGTGTMLHENRLGDIDSLLYGNDWIFKLEQFKAFQPDEGEEFFSVFTPDKIESIRNHLKERLAYEFDPQVPGYCELSFRSRDAEDSSLILGKLCSIIKKRYAETMDWTTLARVERGERVRRIPWMAMLIFGTTGLGFGLLWSELSRRTKA